MEEIWRTLCPHGAICCTCERAIKSRVKLFPLCAVDLRNNLFFQTKLSSAGSWPWMKPTMVFQKSAWLVIIILCPMLSCHLMDSLHCLGHGTKPSAYGIWMRKSRKALASFADVTCRVRTGPGKPWNFVFSLSRPGKTWGITQGHGKSFKQYYLS